MERRRVSPDPKTESVWDYPRPPRLEKNTRHLQVIFQGVTIADSRRGYRVLETSHPPTYYIPDEDIDLAYLLPAAGSSLCEWKGAARYFTVSANGRQVERAAWGYPAPSPAFAPLKNHVAFYAGPMDACYVDGEQVVPQPGGFYGGWITQNIIGPFKGAPGTSGW